MTALELFSTTLHSDGNLTNYWRFEGNSNADTGGTNGTDTSITYNSGNGKFNQGAGGDGSTSKIAFATPIIPVGSKTISLWVKTTTTADSMVICNSRIGTGDFGENIRVQTDGTIRYDANYTAGSTNTVSIATVNDGNFHHVVVVHTDGSSAQIYIDGVASGSASATYTDGGARSINLQMFMDPGSFPKPYNGALDDVAFFSRALTLTEIQTLALGATAGGAFFAFL